MKLYFCSDIHGSDLCWRKFLAAPKFYGADVIVCGGDITGKFMVPIIRQPDGSWTSPFMGVQRRARTEAELVTLRQRIADAGQYAFETTPEEHEAFEGDQAAIDARFRRLVVERVERWLTMAEERLRGTGVRVLVSGANDDFYEIDQALAGSDVIEDPNGRVVELDRGIEYIGVGYGNPTPWNCPRDKTEEQLGQMIEKVASQLKNPTQAVFNLHVPPYDTNLDVAPELDETLTPKLSVTGGFKMVPVGSKAVRSAIEEYKPLVGLHGHIHESRSAQKIGRTLCINPGSEYGEGVLRGVVLELSSKGLDHYTFTQN